MPGQGRLHWLIAGSVFLLLGACHRHKEVIAFHAASLRHLLADAAAEFHKQNPKINVRLEPSGSQVAARKVTELGMKADLVALADASLIEKIMIPGHAAWNLEFATNEIVLAHGQHSPFTEEISAANWPTILQRPGIRLGRANPDTAPLGYHTLFVWQLAEKSGTFKDDGVGLAARLTQLVPKEHVAVDETEVLGFLESRAIDYAFIYRSTAEDHHLKFVELPVSLNLSRRDMADTYKEAVVEVRMKQADQKSILRGHPITYGLTIPTGAPHLEESQRFVEFLIGPAGQDISRATGFKPLVPAMSRHFEKLPANLRPFATTIP
jgi:molybdate/tungstate transport system substrate-binding protein